jgi:hypothetical protein
MSVGYSIGKGDLDLMLGSVAIDTRDMLTRGQQVTACLTNLTDTQLGNMGYSPGEVSLIRAVQSDISTLEQIITGAATLTAVRDFTANLKQLYGSK